MGIVIYPDHQDLMFYMDALARRYPIQTAEEWGIRRQHILEAMQLIMGQWPEDSRRVPLDVVVEEEFHTDRFIRRRITFASEKDAPRVPAYLLVPRVITGKVPAVLCLHSTHEIGKGVPAGLSPDPSRHYAKELAEQGWITLAPDYPGFGEYDYTFGTLGYRSGTLKAMWDNCRAVDLLQGLPDVDLDRIGVLGHSLGGHNALFTAAIEPRLKAIVSSCGFCAFSRYRDGNLDSWSKPCYMPLIRTRCGNHPAHMPFDFGEIIALLAPRPFLAIAPQRDANFDVQGAKEALETARPIYRLLEANDRLQSRHPDVGHDFPEDMRRLAYDFLKKFLYIGT